MEDEEAGTGRLTVDEDEDGTRTVAWHGSGRRWWHWKQPVAVWATTLSTLMVVLGAAWWVVEHNLLRQSAETFEYLEGLEVLLILIVSLALLVHAHDLAGNLLEKIELRDDSLRVLRVLGLKRWRHSKVVLKNTVESFLVTREGRLEARTTEGLQVLLLGLPASVGASVQAIFETWLRKAEAPAPTTADDVEGAVLIRTGTGVGYRGTSYEFELRFPGFTFRTPHTRLSFGSGPLVWTRRVLLLSASLTFFGFAVAIREAPWTATLVACCGLSPAYLMFSYERGEMRRRSTTRAERIPPRTLRVVDGRVSTTDEVVALGSVAQVRVVPSSRFDGLHTLVAMDREDGAVLRLDAVHLADAEKAAEQLNRALP